MFFLILVVACGNGTKYTMTFAGKVINSDTGEWSDDLLVLVFLKKHGDDKGVEVGRSITTLGEFGPSGEGVHNGLLVITFDNVYKLSDMTSVNYEGEQLNFNQRGDIDFYTWFPSLDAGSLNNIEIPEKNISYIIKVIPGKTSTLPQAILEPGSTSLTSDGRIIVSIPEPAKDADVPYPSPDDPEFGKDAALTGIKYDTEVEEVLFKKFAVLLNNCGGSSIISQEYSQTQTFIHEYHTEVSAGISIPIAAILTAELEGKYGFIQGEVNTETVRSYMEASSGSNQVYTVTWYEVWGSGVAEVASGDTIIEVPFRIKTDLIYAIDSEKLECN